MVEGQAVLGMRFRYQVMDWIDEHALVRIPLRMFCIAALVSLAVRCAPEPAQGQCVPGDNNGDGGFSMSDVVYAISYIFGGGAAPVACPCPESFFLFDGEFPTAVETYYDDSNWIWSQFGALQLRQEHGVRMVYRINGPDSSRSIYWLVPDSAREMLNAAVDSMDFHGMWRIEP